MQHDILSAVTAPCAAARRWRKLARCGRACAASVAPLKRAARYSSTVQARQRSCEQNARPLQSALLPLVEVVVGLAAARGVGKLVHFLEPTTPWRFALDVHPTQPRESDFTFHSRPLDAGEAPFNHSGWPTTLDAPMRPLPSWGVVLNSASEPPASPACTNASPPCGLPTTRKLVPHGGTELRIGEWPVAFEGLLASTV